MLFRLMAIITLNFGADRELSMSDIRFSLLAEHTLDFRLQIRGPLLEAFAGLDTG